MPYKIWEQENTLYVKYKVRNYHVDSYGHANNATYLLFLEDARTDFFSYAGFSLSFLAKNSVFIFISEINIKYIKPLFLDDIIHVTANISEIGKVRATWHQQILKGDEIVADAYVKGAFLNRNGKIIKIPDYVLKFFKSIYKN